MRKMDVSFVLEACTMQF